MTKLITRAASGALEAVKLGAGLVDGAVKAVAHQVFRGDKKVDEADRVPPQRQAKQHTPGGIPKDMPRPTVVEPTDPYDIEVETPVGTTGAGPAYNPSTAEADLQQPGTEPLMDPSTTKRIKAETDILRKAAERNPE